MKKLNHSSSRVQYLQRLVFERQWQLDHGTLPTIRQKVMKYLRRYHDGQFTANQVANGILENPGSVSSQLHKLYLAKAIGATYVDKDHLPRYRSGPLRSPPPVPVAGD
jgi:hypothetical protein